MSKSAVLLLAMSCVNAQSVREWVQAHKPQILSDVARFLTIPNVASDSPDIRRKAGELLRMLKSRGVDV